MIMVNKYCVWKSQRLDMNNITVLFIKNISSFLKPIQNTHVCCFIIIFIIVLTKYKISLQDLVLNLKFNVL
jgi:hypothetical protein